MTKLDVIVVVDIDVYLGFTKAEAVEKSSLATSRIMHTRETAKNRHVFPEINPRQNIFSEPHSYELYSLELVVSGLCCHVK